MPLKTQGMLRWKAAFLHDSLLKHRIGNLAEPRDIAAENIVSGNAEFLRGIVGGAEDIGHDVPQLRINLFKGPRLHAGVLGHFQLAGGYSPGIGAFAGFCIITQSACNIKEQSI